MERKLLVGLFCVLPTLSALAAGPSMLDRRAGFATAVDASGRVYAIGGRVDGAVERFDSRLGRWERVASLREPRYSFAATFGRDGRLYVFGGRVTRPSGVTVLKSIDVYDPATDRWAALGQMNWAREGLAAVTLPDGAILLIGGRMVLGRDEAPEGQSWDGPGVSLVELYTPQDGRINPTRALQIRRHGMAAVASNEGRVFVVGGEFLGNLPDVRLPAGVKAVLAPELRNPEGTWSTGSLMRFGRSNLAAVLAPNGDLYALGGFRRTQGGVLKHVEKYDPKLDRWSLAAPMPTARSGFGAAVVEGKIYVFGGVDSDWRALDTLDVFDPATGTWNR